MFNFFAELKERFVDIKDKVNPYQIIMMGDFLMYVEGIVSLMTMQKESIVFKVNGGVIIVSGKDLNIKDLTNNTLAITGKIFSWEKI